jgi:hypothetical protein
MRDPAPPAPRPARTNRHPTRLAADHPQPGMTPPGQDTRTGRTHQLPRHQPPFDLRRVLAYRQHQVPPRTAARPSRAWPKDHGRAAARPNLPRVMTSSNKGNPPGLPSIRSSPSTTPTGSYVLSQSAWGQIVIRAAPPCMFTPPANCLSSRPGERPRPTRNSPTRSPSRRTSPPTPAARSRPTTRPHNGMHGHRPGSIPSRHGAIGSRLLPDTVRSLWGGQGTSALRS